MSRPPLRLLFITRHSPLPGEHGSAAYAFDLLRHLASEGFEVTCLWVNQALNGKRGWCTVPPEADAVFALRVPGYFRVGQWLVHPRLLLRHWVKRAVRVIRPARSRRGLGAWNQPASNHELRLARECADAIQPDVIIANYYWMTGTLGVAPRSAVRAVLAHDVFHQRAADMRALGVEVNAGEVSREAEADCLGRAQMVIAITEDDAAIFRLMLPGHEVLVAPKAAMLPAVSLARSEVPGRCLFVGGESPPNVDGIDWFLREVWPLVLAARPDAELHLCGKVGEKLDELPPRVVRRGVVDSLAEEYAAAQAVIVPLRAGSGLKIKLVEALAHGSACVSTSVGLQGLPTLGHGSEILRADAADDFARAVLEIFGNHALRVHLQTAGRAEVAERLSPARTYGPVAARLRELAAVQSSEPSAPARQADTLLAHAR